MKVSIHQPNFLPWKGFFKKIESSDIFVILDTVKCSKNSYFNRNRFSTDKKSNNFFWLSLPIGKENYRLEIKDVICKDTSSLRKHVKYFKNRHGKTSNKQLLDSILSVYDNMIISNDQSFNVAEFNFLMMRAILNHLKIDTEIIKSSDLNIESSFKKQDLVLEILRKTQCKTYISGTGAMEYQKDKDFLNNGIVLEYNNVDVKPEDLIKDQHMSIVDLLLGGANW